MSRKFKESALLAYGIAIALSGGEGVIMHGDDGGNGRQVHKPVPKYKLIPKGCKRYYFWENGIWFLFEEANTVYSCIALSEKRAIDKFNKNYSK